MPKFRVEITDTTTTMREAWFDAADEAAARHQAESEDWRDWQTVSTHTDCGVTDIEAAQDE